MLVVHSNTGQDLFTPRISSIPDLLLVTLLEETERIQAQGFSLNIIGKCRDSTFRSHAAEQYLALLSYLDSLFKQCY